MPGKYTDSKSNMTSTNTMCDISRFVVVVPIPDESSATIIDCFLICVDEVWFVSFRCSR